MTIQEFSPPFLAFCEVFNRTFSDDGVALWYAAFADLPAREFSLAVSRFIREAKGGEFPTPGELRKLCPSGCRDEDRAQVAWSVAVIASRRHGYNQSVNFEDPLVNATIRLMGGWEEFRNWTPKEAPFREREFLAKYQLLCRTGAGDGSPLIGFCDRSNRANGHERGEAPVQVPCGLSAHPMARRLKFEAAKRLTGPAAASLRGIGLVPDGVST